MVPAATFESNLEVRIACQLADRTETKPTRDSHGRVEELSLDGDVWSSGPVCLGEHDPVTESMARTRRLDHGEPAASRTRSSATSGCCPARGSGREMELVGGGEGALLGLLRLLRLRVPRVRLVRGLVVRRRHGSVSGWRCRRRRQLAVACTPGSSGWALGRARIRS